MQDTYRQLEDQLSKFFEIHLSRLKFMSRFLVGLIHLRTVNYAELALSLNGEIETDSNYKRIQRFFRGFNFPFESLSKFVWSLFDQRGCEIVLSLDRTNWKFGKKNINI